MYDNEIVYVDPDIEDLVPLFMENRRNDVELIKQLLLDSNMEEIKRLGHSMKGAGAGYGFEEISSIGKKIEEAAQEEDKNSIEALNERLDLYLKKVVIKLDSE